MTTFRSRNFSAKPNKAQIQNIALTKVWQKCRINQCPNSFPNRSSCRWTVRHISLSTLEIFELVLLEQGVFTTDQHCSTMNSFWNRNKLAVWHIGFRHRLGAARMARGNQRDQAREKAAKANKVLLLTHNSNSSSLNAPLSEENLIYVKCNQPSWTMMNPCLFRGRTRLRRIRRPTLAWPKSSGWRGEWGAPRFLELSFPY